MNRTELEDLRTHLETHVRGLTEILRKVQLQLENPAPPDYDPYDTLDDDLEQAAENALHD